MTLFINRGGPVKIRIGKARDCYWATIRKGEVIDLTLEKGLSYGFSVKTTEGQIGNKKVETKQIERSVDSFDAQQDFFKELKKIKGIGIKTAQDIIRIFPERKDLKNAIYNNEKIPLRDDVENLLKEEYGSN